jgi:hypothetical protein
MVGQPGFRSGGPISVHSDTYIWVRSATVDVYKPGRLTRVQSVKPEVDQRDPALNAILPGDSRLEKVADGFAFTEGPVALPDGSLGEAEPFFGMTSAPGEDAIDGLKVDQGGNLYVSGPGGLWIISPEGKHLGTLHGPEHPHNMAWGAADHRTLYLAAQTSIYRIKLNIPGSGAWERQRIAVKGGATRM